MAKITRRIEAAKSTLRSSGRSAHIYAVSFWVASVVLFWGAFSELVNLSFHDQRSSHILLIPFIGSILICLGRNRIFRALRYCPSIGLPILLVAALLWYALRAPLFQLNETDRLSGIAAVIFLVWIGGFILFYGIGAAKAAAFPLFFLLLMIPIPVGLAETMVSFLQRGSAETCHALFVLVGVPVVRHGFQFSLPGVDIEVAEQCSGIHSALALFIAGLLMQHFLVQGIWKKIVFILCILPIAIFKNAVRIVTIAWLGIHVNPNFFHGQLHRQGGLFFAVLAAAMLGALVWLLGSRVLTPSRSKDASSGYLSSGVA